MHEHPNFLFDLIYRLKHIESREIQFNFRRRLNAHHSEDQKYEEMKTHAEIQLKLFKDAKQFYVDNKEAILTYQMTEDERAYINMLEKLISDDLERAIFED